MVCTMQHIVFSTIRKYVMLLFVSDVSCNIFNKYNLVSVLRIVT
jgi:hypothetical protein